MKPSEIVESYANLGKQFKVTADKTIDDWKPDEPPITLLLAAFAQVTADSAREGSKEIVITTLSLTEKLMSSKEQTVRDVVATGFLEALLAYASNGKLDFRLVSPHLGANSQAHCRKWDSFTGVKTPGLWKEVNYTDHKKPGEDPRANRFRI